MNAGAGLAVVITEGGAGRIGLVPGSGPLERAAGSIAANLSKPVVGYLAGFTAPAGKTTGHAGGTFLRWTAPDLHLRPFTARR